MSNYKEYLHLGLLLWSDVLPKTPSLAYVMSETRDNQTAVLRLAASLLHRGAINAIAIPDPQSPIYNYGYPGPICYSSQLKQEGVSDEGIIRVASESALLNINTFTETQLLANFLLHSDRDSVVIIAPVFHLLRSYLSALTALKEQGVEGIKVYTQGAVIPVYDIVTHSQGIQRGTRAEITLEEIDKCAKYANLISPQEALIIHKRHRT